MTQDDSRRNIGAISWTDLTVTDAEDVRTFYEQVVGWSAQPVDMGGYPDYCMQQPSDSVGEARKTVAGICHARGANADMPSAQWIVYITVADLAQSMERCKQLGGTVLHHRPNSNAPGGFAVIRDPAGAVCALYQD
jgi:hypothetical protein